MLRKANLLRKVLGLCPRSDRVLRVIGQRALRQRKYGALLNCIPPHQNFLCPGSQAHIRVGPETSLATQAKSLPAEFCRQACLGGGSIELTALALRLAGEGAQRIGVKSVYRRHGVPGLV